MLSDGESRTIRKKLETLPFEVVAYREDCDTPYVYLGTGNEAEFSLTDTQVIELIDRLKRALDILPTSK